jgi:pimeloyl-ACP methyl ester carboxylesterase
MREVIDMEMQLVKRFGSFRTLPRAPRTLPSTPMWSFLARPLDQLAIRSACGSVLPSPDGQAHAAEASELLNRPDFFAPEVSAASVRFTEGDHFQFESPVRSDFAGNNLVRGRFVTAGENWRTRPSVILLHGWNAELQYEWQSPGWARLLARAGVNTFYFQLPFHGDRRPGANEAIRNFFSGNLLHVMRATHQSLADARALARWLRAQGSPCVGLWGVSLGAWLAGLASAYQSEIDFAVLVTPVVRMDRALQDLPFCAAIRDDLSHLHGEFRRLNLVEHAPRLSADRLLVLAAQHDLFAAPETIDELAAVWRPEVWRYPHGHISLLFASSVMQRAAKWVGRQAAACAESRRFYETPGMRKRER